MYCNLQKNHITAVTWKLLKENLASTTTLKSKLKETSYPPSLASKKFDKIINRTH